MRRKTRKRELVGGCERVGRKMKMRLKRGRRESERAVESESVKER